MISQLASVDISEIFSLERGTSVCRDYGLEPGQAMDLKNGCNFYLEADRQKAGDSIANDKPKLGIGSPPCTLFLRPQELNKHMHRNNAAWIAQIEENIAQAKRYVRFCIKIYNHQRESGRYFLREHPWPATSWFLPEMTKLREEKDVQKIRTDMCQFGMMSRTAGVGSPLGHVLKATGFLTNSKHIGRELGRICNREHEHAPLVGGRAAAAGIYPHRLCCAMCKGLAAQLREDQGPRIDASVVCLNGLKSLICLCQEATSAELNKSHKESV